MGNGSWNAVNLTRDCQFNYIEFIGQISDIYFASFQLCAVIALTHFRRSSLLSQHQRSVDLLSATPCWSYETRPPFHAKRRLSASCLELIYNLTFHLPESRHFTSLQLHFMTDQTDLLKVAHTHTQHTHCAVTRTHCPSTVGTQCVLTNRIINLMCDLFVRPQLDRNFNRLAIGRRNERQREREISAKASTKRTLESVVKFN